LSGSSVASAVAVAVAFPTTRRAGAVHAYDDARYFVASLVRPGDALCKPIPPELWEPILVNAADWVLVLRGFERGDGAAVVQEWRCEVLALR